MKDRWAWLAIPVTIFGGIGWFSGLYAAVKTHSALLFVIDFAVPPAGIIHGYGFLFGLW